jgi:N-acetylneuraminic acid mutarotase
MALRAAAAGDVSESAERAELFAPGAIAADGAYTITFTPDGRTAYFCRALGDGAARRGTILFSRLESGAWSAPEIAPFSGRYIDMDPMLSPDGSELFFASVRPEAPGRPSLWRVRRAGAGWGPAEPMREATGGDGVAVFPCPTASGNLYFAGQRPGAASIGGDDLWVCRRRADGTFAAPENLGPAVNSAAQDYDAYVAPDESFLIFASRRSGGINGSDFYVSVRGHGAWQPARNLGPLVNLPGATGICGPYVSPDREWFYFTSNHGARPGIHRIRFAALGLAGVAAERATAVDASADAGPLRVVRKPPFAKGGMRFLYQAPLVMNERMYVLRDRVFEYDPVRERWAEFTARPQVKRWHHASAAAEGRLFMIGGSVNGEPRDWVDAVEAFDPDTARWARRAPLPGPRRNAGAVTVGNTIVVIGGEGEPPGAMPIVAYGPRADQWTPRRARSTIRHCWGAQVIQGKVYVLGTANAREIPELVLEEYDPLSDTIRIRAPLPRPRMAFATAVAGDRLVVLGGSPGGNAPLAGVDVYDPAEDRWSAAADLPEPRCWLGAARLGPSIFVLGGVAGDFRQATTRFYAFDTAELPGAIPGAP